MQNSLQQKLRTINIQRQCYAMASEDGQSADIIMYGEIVETAPTNWWTGEKVEGNFIVQSEFLQDLKTVSSAKSITIHMNSVGGDAGVSILIHNRIREMAAKGVIFTCIVDGVAMSGGSLIMCACDTVQVNPSSLIMIHKCWSTLWGGYNADELRQMASTNDAWDKAQVSIYKRKCGLSDTVISHMMAATTYMTGEEAVEKGFADELLMDAEPLDIAASADGRSLYVRGRMVHLVPGMFAPDTIPTVNSGANQPVQTNTNQPENPGAEGGHNNMTLEELKQKHPDLVVQIKEEAVSAVDSAAVQAEQQRLQEIDEVAGSLDAMLVQEAKYGKTACSAQELCYRAARLASQKGKKFLGDLDLDAQVSGTGNVNAVPDSSFEDAMPETPRQCMESARAKVKNLLGKEG